MNLYLVFTLGFIAQILFASRLLVQWIKSEKAGRVLSPTLFWQLSLAASFLMMAYGILRKDFVIVLGQAIAYFVYIRNLQFKNAWAYLPFYFKILVLAFPVISAIWLLFSGTYSLGQLLHNKEVSEFMMMWGSAGQVIFTFRFLYQCYFSEKHKKSVFPVGFWMISLLGSVIILAYAVYRIDPVLFVGQVFGVVIYVRNVFLHYQTSTKYGVENSKY